MAVLFHEIPGNVNWEQLRETLTKDDFHNGRTTHQLRLSFENSQVHAFANDKERCVGTARALSDGVGNAYVIDVWTHSSYRKQGIATEMMEMMMRKCPGQHIYLQTDDAIQFYRDLGFVDQPLGMSIVVGEYLQNDTRN
jgi:ribosomal protein S18 acetylase RimI-like enzyme